jgi:hypothetical protein
MTADLRNRYGSFRDLDLPVLAESAFIKGL